MFRALKDRLFLNRNVQKAVDKYEKMYPCGSLPFGKGLGGTLRGNLTELMKLNKQFHTPKFNTIINYCPKNYRFVLKNKIKGKNSESISPPGILLLSPTTKIKYVTNCYTQKLVFKQSVVLEDKVLLDYKVHIAFHVSPFSERINPLLEPLSEILFILKYIRINLSKNFSAYLPKPHRTVDLDALRKMLNKGYAYPEIRIEYKVIDHFPNSEEEGKEIRSTGTSGMLNEIRKLRV